ncbi:uncharacterized protein isoform X4 [Danio rerio]|uniref:Uncharacterized protein isoform X4 n=1 Tax=Danio rerio TaxID=7955 RepID=A0A8M9PVL5_DANRE|nr:uncharacterized protein LOC110438257 [Danio rerio]|eukprot:XP_021325130.1 uncharacterized protein LOC110438257 [Danio rerio]
MIHTGLLICMFLWHLIGVVGVDEVNSVSVMEGDSVTLHTHLQILKDEVTEWTFNNTLIAKVTEDNPTYNKDERFTNRLKLDHQTGSLTITNIKTTDSGIYTFTTIIDKKQPTKRFSVTVYASLSTNTITSQNSSSTANGRDSLISAGAGAAAGSLLIVAAVGMIWFYRKNKRTNQSVQTHNEEVTYADPTFYKRSKSKGSVKQEDEVVYAGVVTRR